MAEGYRGTTAEQDNRFKDKTAKLLRTMKFPEIFEKKVDMRKVELSVMKPWIAQKINTLLGFEDEVVIEYVNGLLEDEAAPVIDPKKMQISLTGFLEKKTPIFMAELWRLLLSAQDSPVKVPAEFIEQKKEEMRKRKEEQELAVSKRGDEIAELQAGREKMDEVRQRERGERRQFTDERGRGRGRGRGSFRGERDSGYRNRGDRRRSPSPDRRRRSPSPERRRRHSPSSASSTRSNSPPPRKRARSRSYSRSPPRRRSRDRRRHSPSPDRRRRSPSPDRKSRKRSPAEDEKMSPRRRRSVSADRRSNSRRRRSPSPERHFKDDKSRRNDRRRRSPSPDRRRRSPSVDEKMDRSRRRDDSPRRGSREKREVSPPTPKGRQESTPPPGADEREGLLKEKILREKARRDRA